MISRERKTFVMSWHTKFKIYKRKEINNATSSGKLLIHLNNDALKKLIFGYTYRRPGDLVSL